MNDDDLIPVAATLTAALLPANPKQAVTLFFEMHEALIEEKRARVNQRPVYLTIGELTETEIDPRDNPPESICRT